MLTIADFQANYYIPRGTTERTVLQRRLDRLVSEQLPAVLDGRLRPPAIDETAVYRIRHLQLDLWVDALGMSDGEIAHRWSRLLLHAVTRALLYGGVGEVVRYDDHAHFLAAFLADLLCGIAWSRWNYEEFTPLRGLPIGQITAQLLAPYPDLLGPVAERLHGGRQLERLLQELHPADVELIWQRGLEFGPPAATWHPPPTLAAEMLQAVRTGVALETTSGGWQRNLLRLYLAVIMARPSLARNPAVGGIIHHLVRLHQLWQKRPSPLLWAALVQQEINSPAALDALLTGLDADLAPVCDWLRASLITPAGRAYLAQLAPVVLPAHDWLQASLAAPDGCTYLAQPAPVVQPAEVQSSDRAAAEQGQPWRIATTFAGLAFLLPVIRDLGLYKQLNAAGLYQVLLAALGLPRQPLAWGDSAVCWLAGLAPHEEERARTAAVDWPDLAQWGDAIALSEAAEEAAGHLGPLPGSAVTLMLLREFASGLRGFTASSPGYLAKQFINQPGQLHVDGASIHAYLSRSPLGVVLQMAGREGDQGPIPWLNSRQLTIYLPDG